MKFVLCTLVVTLVLFVNLPANAQDFGAFKRIPVLHEGRVKPIDSVGRLYLKKFSGEEGRASAFLAQVLFDPLAATERPVFFIREAQILTQLGLEARRGHLFSLSELAPGLQATEPQLQKLLQEEESEWTVAQRQFIELHRDALVYGQLLGTFSFMLPLALPVPDGLGIDVGEVGVTFVDLQPHIPVLEKRLTAIIKDKGNDPSAYDTQEQSLAMLLFRLQTMVQGFSRNDRFRIYLNNDWIPVWQLSDGEDVQDALTQWQKLAYAYRDRDFDAFTQAAQSLQIEQYRFAVSLEVFYRTLNPFFWATAFYTLALLCSAAYLMRGMPIMFTAAVCSAGAAFLVQTGGVVMRSLILARPPVGSLYESLLFVGLIVMAAALLILFFRRQIVPVLAGVLAALGLLLIAPVVAPDGDNLETLVAVLSTNFWLATHVLCITAGYGVCVLTAMLAHVYLFGRARGYRADGLWSLMYKTGMVGLFFTAFGTMLGGVWADQSWGRFWGWDPKENGALLIVLWLVWLVHARLGKHLSRLWLAAGFAMLNIIVALAWFGVNLLSVGLHSYGFISGLAVGLSLFCAGEFALIWSLLFFARRKRREV